MKGGKKKTTELLPSLRPPPPTSVNAYLLSLKLQVEETIT